MRVHARRSAGSAREIMLGKQAAETLKLKIGDLIRLTGGTFKVVGIYNSGDGFEDAASIVSLPESKSVAAGRTMSIVASFD